MTMATKTVTKKRGRPAWATGRRTFNFGAKHEEMLSVLLQKAKQTDHRANMTTVVEKAIEEKYARDIPSE